MGYGLAIISLVWVFRDFHLRRTIREFSNVSWRWAFLGMLFDVLSYCVQGLRWKLLLTPFGRVRLIRSTRAVFAGLFANLVFPLRPGELLRSVLLSGWECIKFGRVLGS
ncbi:MAG TPA: lysylphosphatidylglycerol synthase domain-containing protein, partial [Candidatus Acidoferrales bacterium]|nr:lysylphosphatidylglycerol synthase domain-containing protein [Candidatus Acidoferrales bacterium]